MPRWPLGKLQNCQGITKAGTLFSSSMVMAQTTNSGHFWSYLYPTTLDWLLCPNLWQRPCNDRTMASYSFPLPRAIGAITYSMSFLTSEQLSRASPGLKSWLWRQFCGVQVLWEACGSNGFWHFHLVSPPATDYQLSPHQGLGIQQWANTDMVPEVVKLVSWGSCVWIKESHKHR